MTTLDPTKILNYGVVGLGFLLAFLAYRLLTQEQKKREPSVRVLQAIYVFMAFSLLLCITGLGADYIKSRPNTSSSSADQNAFTKYLSDLRIEYEHGETPSNFSRGYLKELQTATLPLNFAGGHCENYLVATNVGNTIEVYQWANGPGSRDLNASFNGDSNYKTGSICTADRPDATAQIGLVVKMLSGSGPYSIETYFASQINFPNSPSRGSSIPR